MGDAGRPASGRRISNAELVPAAGRDLPCVAMRVLSNTAISLDGRIHTRDERPPVLGTRHDLRRMRVLRGQVDAVLVGGATFRRWPIAALPDDDALARRTQPFWNIVVTRRADITPRPAFIAEQRIKKLILTTPHYKTPAFDADIDICPQENIDIQWMINALERRGIKSVMIEAGGDLMAQFLAADLVDEMFVTICPILIGGKSNASLVNGAGFLAEQVPRLKLQHLERIEDEVYLHYFVIKRQGNR